MVHALDISCLDYYIGLLDRFSSFSIVVFKVKCTKLCGLFLTFLSLQEDDGPVFLAHNVRKLYPWWGINPLFLFELWLHEKAGIDSVG